MSIQVCQVKESPQLDFVTVTLSRPFQRKGRYLIQPFDKSPFINRKYKIIKRQNKNTTKRSITQRLRHFRFLLQFRFSGLYTSCIIVSTFFFSPPEHLFAVTYITANTRCLHCLINEIVIHFNGNIFLVF